METPKTGDGLTSPLPMDRGLTPEPAESLDDSLAKLGRTVKVDQLRVQVVRRVRLLRHRRWCCGTGLAWFSWSNRIAWRRGTCRYDNLLLWWNRKAQ